MSALQARVGASSLSVAMIVRDEEATLGDTLASIRHVVDEIVVIDTGSVDRSREVARQAGARVIEHEWNDDFSAARNVAWSAVRGTWVLWIDAGERLTPESAVALREFINRNPAYDKAYLLMVEIPPPAVEGYAEQAARVRLVPNVPGLRFVGRVRESLDESLRQQGIGFELGPWRLKRGMREHEPERKRRRAARDLQLLELEIQERGALPGLLVALGELHNEIDERATAAAYFRRAISGASRGSRAMLEAYYGLLTSYDEQQADQREARVTTCVEALEVYPFDAQLLCAMGSYLQSQGRLDLATRSYQTAHQFGQIQPETWHVPAMGEVAAVCLSLTLQLAEREAEARQVVEEYLAKHPHSTRARRRYLELLVRHEDESRALEQIDLLPAETPHRTALRSVVRGGVQAAKQNWTSAIAYLQTARDAGCRDPLCLRWLAIAQISLGDLEAAEATLLDWQAVEPQNAEIAECRQALRPVLEESSEATSQAFQGALSTFTLDAPPAVLEASSKPWSNQASWGLPQNTPEGGERGEGLQASPAVIQQLCETMLGHGLVDDALQLSARLGSGDATTRLCRILDGSGLATSRARSFGSTTVRGSAAGWLQPTLAVRILDRCAVGGRSRRGSTGSLERGGWAMARPHRAEPATNQVGSCTPLAARWHEPGSRRQRPSFEGCKCLSCERPAHLAGSLNPADLIRLATVPICKRFGDESPTKYLCDVALLDICRRLD